MWKVLLAGLVILAVFSGCIVNPKCSNGYTIKCYNGPVITKESISCSTSEDCTKEKMISACSPDYPDMNACGEGPGIMPFKCANNVCVWLPGV